MQTLIAAGWGFLGALMFAAPNLVLCLYQCHRAEKHWVWCVADFAVAMVVGVGAAAGGTYWGADLLGVSADPHKIPGISILIGLLANPVAPVLISGVPKRILRRIEGREPAE